MEAVERRSESPSPGTRSSSRLSNLSDPESDIGTKKRTSTSRRKSRTAEKENGDAMVIAAETNGELVQSEEATAEIVTETEKVNDVANGIMSDEEHNGHGDGHQQEEPEVDTTDRDVGSSTSQANELTVVVTPVNGEEDAKELSDGHDTSNGKDAEESFVTADTESIRLNRTTSSGDLISSGVSSDNGNVDSEGTDDDGTVSATPGTATAIEEPEKTKGGFLGKWTSIFDREEPTKTNGHSSDMLNVRNNLYFSSVRGRVPIRLAGERQKTPTRSINLDDSFRVKSEPSRKSSEERRNLRKFPGKRCLNNDDSDESFLSSLSFTRKKRRVDEDKASTGFFKSFLWSPFRKLSVTTNGSTDKVAPAEPEATSAKATTATTSWFKSPFWFWRRNGSTSNGTAAVNGNSEEERN